ncbi:MAG TPA: penicillin-binding transpeptidase domain-containing protein, partial [Planctomycetaceae bacterium]
GTLELHPIDLLGAYGAIANGGVLMPRTTILKVVDAEGKVVYPAAEAAKPKTVISPQTAYIMTDILAGNTEPKTNPFWGEWAIYDNGVRRPAAYKTGTTNDNRDVHAYGYLAPPKATTVISPQAAYIITDILAGNTDPKVNPFWGEWAIYDGGHRRPAAYKTGTTNDNRDVHAYGYLAPPKDPKAPALAVGVWMGNSNNEPNRDTLSLGSSAPLWSRILTEVSKGTPIAAFKAPKGLVTASVDAFSGMKPGPFTTKTVKELFISGTEPTQSDDLRRTVDIDTASGKLWQDGCVGPMKTIGALDFSQVDADHPSWQKADNGWAKRAARGSGVGGGLKGSATQFFYGSGFFPFGRSWGGTFAPTTLCPLAPPSPTPCDNPFGLFCPTPPPSGAPQPTPPHGPGKTPKP